MQWGSLSGPPGGYAHVIEDTSKFPRTLGLDTVAGMIGAMPQRFGARKRDARGRAEREHASVRAFVKRWSRFDWTAKLEGGGYQK